jgi:tRNA-2-methylthio-N6-dimethylallyladenosine synthase
VDAPDKADMVILNTCHIREKAAEKVYSELGRLKKLKDINENMIIGVAGCVAQAEGEEMLSRAPTVDLVFGPQTFQALPEMLEELADNRADALEENGHIKKAKGVVRTSFPAEEKFATLFETPRQPLVRSPAAFVTVQEGCDKFCTFCVVPYTRGAEVSRAAAEIEAEVVSLAQKGVSEITLLGQNVNAWLDVEEDDMGLGQLLRRLAKVDGIERLRYTTSHPRDMDDALIEAHADLPELMPYLHLPVQAGSNKILKAMNRKHTAEDYIELVDRIRTARPDIALSSDFIVGFPGETEEDFTATLDLVKRVTYAQAYSFKYSPRPGTPASEEEQIAEDVKSERLARLQDVLNAQQVTFNASQTNEMLEVLFEKQGKKVGQMVGRSPYLQTVHVDADETVIGRILPVKIEKAHANSLSGRISSI